MDGASKRLSSFDVKGVAEYIKSGKAKRIVLLVGAGISTELGIPDFRSVGTGIYSNLGKYKLNDPKDIFTLDYFNKNPEPFYDICPTLLPGSHKPTFIHYFANHMNKLNILHRMLTQNIDGLERVAGVPLEKLVECHGTFYTAHCTECKKEYKLDEIREKLKTGKVLKCSSKGCNGNVKPDIIFFGEKLPGEFNAIARTSCRECDMMIIIGTTLVVQPFAALPGACGEDVPRVLVNMDKVAMYTETEEEIDGQICKIKPNNWRALLWYDRPDNKRDVYLGGDCQASIKQLAKELGWYDDIMKEMKKR